MLNKEKLAGAARNEVAGHIRVYPGSWIDEIVEDIEDKDAFIRAVLAEHVEDKGSASETACRAVRLFAEKAGQSAYDSIIGHPGII